MYCDNCPFYVKPSAGSFAGRCRVCGSATRPDDECLHSSASSGAFPEVLAGLGQDLAESQKEQLLGVMKLLAGVSQGEGGKELREEKIIESPAVEPPSAPKPESQLARPAAMLPRLAFHAVPSGCFAPPETDSQGAVFLYAASLAFDAYGNAAYGTGLCASVPEGWVAVLTPLADITSRDLVMSPSPVFLASGDRSEITVSFKPAAVFCESLRRKPEGGNGYDFVTIPARQDFSPDKRMYPVPDECSFNARLYRVGERICQLRMLPLAISDLATEGV